MKNTLHITSGDVAGGMLAETGLGGDVFVWHDIMYDGPRKPGLPDDETLAARAVFLEETTGGGLNRQDILKTLHDQYARLAKAADQDEIVLWFDACLFDQSMLVHILALMPADAIPKTTLLCVDAFPGIVPFNGLGQLTPEQLASLFSKREPITDELVHFAKRADNAFALQDANQLQEISAMLDAPLPHVPAAVIRWLMERPDPKTGLGRLETLAMAAIQNGSHTPGEIFRNVAKADGPPQYWGDITLWAKINNLADRTPPLVKIEGPSPRLPLWNAGPELKEFKVVSLV